MMIRNILALLGLCLLLACSDQPDTKDKAGADLGPSTATGWPAYGGQPTGTQYSALDDITVGNIGRLEEAWTYHAGEISYGGEGADADATNYEVTPIFANDRLYLCTPFNKIVALEPSSGKALWRYDPKKPKTETMYGSHNCRGVAYWQAEAGADIGQGPAKACQKRIFEITTNGWLIGVDADTGLPCEDFGDKGRVDLSAMDYKGEGILNNTSPPAIYRNVAIVGGTVIDNKERNALDGIVRAFDVETGRQLWSWNPIPPELSDKVGGANTWAPMSIDREHGWVVLPTSSPSYDVYGANRTEPIPYGNAVVVLEAETGKLVWSYQTVHHDLWDYDLASMPTLATIMHDGKRTEAVIQASKSGFIFVLDRLTGKPLFPVVERPVPQSDVPGEVSAPTQPVPTLPAPVTSQHMSAKDGWGALLFDEKACEKKLAGLRNEGIFTPPSVHGSILHPSFLGGVNWGGVALDEETGIAVVNSSNLVASVTLIPREQYDPKRDRKPGVSVYQMKGSPYVLLRQVLLSPLGAPCNPPPWGNLTAIDMNSGKTLWKVPFGQVKLAGPIKSLASWGAPNQGGPIITKGGLVFIGASPDNVFRAYDIRTGKVVWSRSIPASAIATPMTYRDRKTGKQFVVVAAGGHDGLTPNLSDAIVAYAIKD